jgi:hypothetical protein
MVEIFIITGLAILSGILGRMGGAHGYDTKFRDVGCSAIVVGGCVVLFGWHPAQWWAYVAIFALTWAAMTTYLDSIFGYDNLWASGALVGAAAFPAIWVGVPWWIIVARVVVLCVIWGCLNKFLPEKVLCWRRDVAEEFSRYFFSL